MSTSINFISLQKDTFPSLFFAFSLSLSYCFLLIFLSFNLFLFSAIHSLALPFSLLLNYFYLTTPFSLPSSTTLCLIYRSLSSVFLSLSSSYLSSYLCLCLFVQYFLHFTSFSCCRFREYPPNCNRILFQSEIVSRRKRRKRR